MAVSYKEVSLCPRLRELKLTKFSTHNRDLKVHSVSLQELTVENVLIPSIDIVAPSLKKVTMSACSRIDELSISVLVVAADGSKTGTDNFVTHLCLCQQWHCTKAIEQHLIAAFSVLEIHLETVGHAFGAFVFHLIGMNRIRSAMRKLKEKEGCPTDCHCRPTNWNTKTIALTALEEMEIDGFMGEDHECDFVELVFMSTPMLTRVIVKLSHELSSSSDGCTKLYNIFKLSCFVTLVVANVLLYPLHIPF
ncbi:uncharacterized protein [Aegilops tauschii subsp. strangulata]|uniref:uncharacterized protein n=1 Tax=Aegilops tauschii subsp. strangulata TaxID=200361 RepID=UPI003CC8997F